MKRLSSTWRTFHKASRLSLFDWWLLVLATLYLARAAVLLRSCPISNVVNLSAPKIQMAGKRRKGAGSATRIGWAISLSAKVVPWKTNCLVQAVAASLLLRRYGCEPQIRIGVRKDGPELAAHAWVDCNGTTIVGGRGDEFTPMSAASHDRLAAFHTNMPS